MAKTNITIFLFPIIFTLVLMGGYAGIRYFVNNHVQHLSCLYPELNEPTWLFEDQVKIFSKVIFGLALFFLVSVTLTMLSRLFGGYVNPVQKDDPLFIQAMNRVLINSTEGVFAFVPSYAYFIFIKSKPDQKNIAITVGTIFVLGRILFGIGYVFGLYINKAQLRSIGHLLGTFALSLVILLNFDFDPFLYI